MNKSEIGRRLAAVRRGIRRAKLDGFLVMDRANTRYVTGFQCSSSFTLIGLEGAWFLTDFRYIEAARKSIQEFDVALQKTPKDSLARLIRRAGIKRLGVEKSLAFGTALEFQKAFAPAELVPNDKPLSNARARKSAGEIAILRQAVRQTDAALVDLAADVCEGWTEIETRNRLRRLIERHGGEGESFDSIVASGPHSSRPHAIPGDRALRRGDIVQIDTGMRLDGYCSDLSRVFSVGRPTEKMRKIHGIVLDAQRRAIDAIRAGVKGSDVHRKAYDVIDRKGYGKCFGHGVGHGVGLDIHESPGLGSRSEDVLREGMVVTSEPGIYLPGWGGIRIEDVVVVRRDGCEILTTAPKAFFVV